MPLSKERMKERKKQDRADSRFDKATSVPQVINPVKPVPLLDAVSPSVTREGYGKVSDIVMLDADGEIIPEL